MRVPLGLPNVSLLMRCWLCLTVRLVVPLRKGASVTCSSKDAVQNILTCRLASALHCWQAGISSSKALQKGR